MREAGDVGQGMESENKVYEGGASRKHVPLKFICSAMETWVVLLLAVFASIELFLVGHQVCFRKWQCEEGFMSPLPRRNSFGQASEAFRRHPQNPMCKPESNSNSNSP